MNHVEQWFHHELNPEYKAAFIENLYHCVHDVKNNDKKVSKKSIKLKSLQNNEVGNTRQQKQQAYRDEKSDRNLSNEEQQKKEIEMLRENIKILENQLHEKGTIEEMFKKLENKNSDKDNTISFSQKWLNRQINTFFPEAFVRNEGDKHIIQFGKHRVGVYVYKYTDLDPIQSLGVLEMCVVEDVNQKNIDFAMIIEPCNKIIPMIGKFKFKLMNTEIGQLKVLYLSNILNEPMKMITSLFFFFDQTKYEKSITNVDYGRILYKIQGIIKKFDHILKSITSRKEYIKSIHKTLKHQEKLLAKDEKLYHEILKVLKESHNPLEIVSEEHTLKEIYKDIIKQKGTVSIDDFKKLCKESGISYRTIYKYGGIKSIKKLVEDENV